MRGFHCACQGRETMRPCNGICVASRADRRDLSPSLKQLLGVDNLWCDTRTEQSAQKFVLWAGHVLEHRAAFEVSQCSCCRCSRRHVILCSRTASRSLQGQVMCTARHKCVFRTSSVETGLRRRLGHRSTGRRGNVKKPSSPAGAVTDLTVPCPGGAAWPVLRLLGAGALGRVVRPGGLPPCQLGAAGTPFNMQNQTHLTAYVTECVGALHCKPHCLAEYSWHCNNCRLHTFLDRAKQVKHEGSASPCCHHPAVSSRS